MLTFLFWNMGGELPEITPPRQVNERKERLRGILANLIHRHQVDLLLLAEWPITQDEILQTINEHNQRPFDAPDPHSFCERLAVYPRFSGRFLTLFGASESPRYTCRHVRLPARQSVLLFVAHLGSKLFKSEESQTLAVAQFSEVVRHAERRAQHQRTILVGDLNLNPFDTAMVGAEGLNAVMTKELALRGSRTVDAREYPYFYNPMWSHFGDSTHELYPPGDPNHEPPGTCYYPAAESRWYYWSILDQVLVRPELVPLLNSREVRILVTDGTTSFLDRRGHPDRKNVSDHLPLFFRLNI
ncbi:MAG: endonuclease/exonuclease/phosphatase family protein [Planctomycetes bacterium]|nr:endonuclease/exonuclease/phosphatase family protein [Planctomycetota bacterium]